MLSSVEVILNAGTLTPAEMNRRFRSGSTPLVLVTSGAGEPEEACVRALADAIEASGAVLAVGSRLPSANSGKAAAAVMRAENAIAGVFDAADLPALGQGLFLLDFGGISMYRRSALLELGGFEADDVSLCRANWTARAVFSGLRICTAREASVSEKAHFSLRGIFSRAFRLGIMLKRDIQIFGWNVPLSGMNGAAWPEAENCLAGTLGIAAQELKTRRAFLSFFRVKAAGIVLKVGILLGKKYLYLPESMGKRALSGNRKAR